MGLDFIRRAAPSFRKGLDRMRIRLATPTLFTHEPTCAPQAYAAALEGDFSPAVGEKLGVRLAENRVLVLRGLTTVGSFASPPPELIDALRASHGEACGVVHAFYDIARVAEISVC